MMCEYCNRRIHAPGCPNAVQEERERRCDYCKDAIEVGEAFLEPEERVRG